ncbi:MAG: complex I NDUFA9 subunit family protein [Proteobacteria bacterium]|nr:complex I NDUFA9 subunit family protein [Pseudomonadota bacterium]
MERRVFTVFGGSGFLGRHLVQRLAASGAHVRVCVRDIEAASFVKVFGDAGQIVPWSADITKPDQVAAAVDGADVVINLVGILFEGFGRTFQGIHVDGAGHVAAAAKAAAERLIHVSAIGADAHSPALYGRTKAAGEVAVLSAFPEATIVRPSIVFGPEDNFFNLFAGLARLTWVMPVFGCPLEPEFKLFPKNGFIEIDLYGDGGTRLQPVFVGDVAEAIMTIVRQPKAAGMTYELGGPTVYSFKEVIDLLLEITNRKRFLAPIPFGLAKFAAWFLEFWPKPILTRDQVDLLKRDNVVTGDKPGFQELGIAPVAAEAVLPTYLHRFRVPARQALPQA